MKVIAVDLGGTNVRVALVDSEGIILSKKSCPIEKEGGEEVLDQIIHLVDPLIEDADGMGIVIPGAITCEGLVWAPNIPGWKDLPLEKILRDKFHPFDVIVKDDRYATILGESHFGAVKGYKNVAYVIIGTGIAAGLMIEGKIYSGSRGLSGSIGWFITDENIIQGADHEIFESKVAGRALKKKLGVNGEELMEMASKGDIKALESLNALGEKIGIGIANLVAVVDPEIVVIGGGVSKSWQYIEGGIRSTLNKWDHPIFKDIKVVCSTLGDDAGILGITRIVMERVGEQN